MTLQATLAFVVIYAALQLAFFVPFASADEHNPKQAAPLARQLVSLSKIGELATVMAPGVRAGRKHYPFSTPEYVSDECPSSGSPLLYLVTWGTHARNVRASPHASVSFRHPNFTLTPPDSRGELDEARVSLLGDLVRVEGDDEIKKAQECFFARHPDAKEFPHHSAFYRLEVQDVRWIGGFGDRHFNGWIPADLYLDNPQGSALQMQGNGLKRRGKRSRID
ncbi:uncharacterized protein SPPG_07963 [Spizellomyces punctatus DAOM BR117]|uniref:CREG-like beta-barrel domain-containing protein n=1 Tax=Spizellomyces punctatus (strain DAOM BR117) TaxID=645134 RepID=A0A0L0H788_SPIPD|nr:uncharacterized protein SPPG_07963 [Spizellomyces punctatus DAOM BR117]KNC96756.1 hypothetical protein SPPG_07963 [Spizellomyces punctatus DAOM BR117]|eukprot:XP_016604796.1 hypothetical protein SPPG_07963 [Spizellomyces punctatus DAOM BR117]